MRAGSLHHERLVARTRRLDYDVDFLGSLMPSDFAWWHHNQGLVSTGLTRRVPVKDVHDVLASIAIEADDDALEYGPVAVGALPFDRAAAGETELVVPSRILRRDVDGNTWVTDVWGDEGAGQGPRLAPDPGPMPSDLPYDMTKAQWAERVKAALAHIDAGELDKVVLSRQVAMARAKDLSLGDVVRRLRANQPGCYVFAAGNFVGASPELLVERQGRTVRSRPMAGTVARSDHPAMTWLAESAKNRREHALVVDEVVRGLEQLCIEPVQVSQPYAEPFADLGHIVTDVVGTLSADSLSALDLALRIHPTPAVAGTPTEVALSLIAELEPRSRGCYGGPVGWVDAKGDGEFAVALRCAQLQLDRAVLYAGAGIVAGSRWDDEWQETEAKLEAMRRALTGR